MGKPYQKGDQVMTEKLELQPTENERVRAAARKMSRHLEPLNEHEQCRVLAVLTELYAPAARLHP